jgi:hypothetical protein
MNPQNPCPRCGRSGFGRADVTSGRQCPLSAPSTKQTSESVYECLLSGVKRTKRALAITRFSRLNSEVRYLMEKVPGRDMWAVIDTVTHRPALVNDVPQIDLGLDNADDLTDLLNRLDGEASVSAKH